MWRKARNLKDWRVPEVCHMPNSTLSIALQSLVACLGAEIKDKREVYTENIWRAAMNTDASLKDMEKLFQAVSACGGKEQYPNLQQS
jgi:hypothetical protein